MNVRSYIYKSNRLTDMEKDSIKEQLIPDIQRNKSVTLEMNTVNNETDCKLKQSSNEHIKTSTIENEYNK